LPGQSLVFAADGGHRKRLLTFLGFCATRPNDAVFEAFSITVRKVEQRYLLLCVLLKNPVFSII
jgi:hypothetical protein